MFRIAWRLTGDQFFLLGREEFQTFEEASTAEGIEKANLATDAHYESVIVLDEKAAA